MNAVESGRSGGRSGSGSNSPLPYTASSHAHIASRAPILNVQSQAMPTPTAVSIPSPKSQVNGSMPLAITLPNSSPLPASASPGATTTSPFSRSLHLPTPPTLVPAASSLPANSATANPVNVGSTRRAQSYNASARATAAAAAAAPTSSQQPIEPLSRPPPRATTPGLPSSASTATSNPSLPTVTNTAPVPAVAHTGSTSLPSTPRDRGHAITTAVGHVALAASGSSSSAATTTSSATHGNDPNGGAAWTPTSSTSASFSSSISTSASARSLPVTPVEWQDDKSVTACHHCRTKFSILTRKHHCRCCGKIHCDNCSKYRAVLPSQPRRASTSSSSTTSFSAGTSGAPSTSTSASTSSTSTASSNTSQSQAERVRVCGKCYYIIKKAKKTAQQLQQQQQQHYQSAKEPEEQKTQAPSSATVSSSKSITSPSKSHGRSIHASTRPPARASSSSPTRVAALVSELEALHALHSSYQPEHHYLTSLLSNAAQTEVVYVETIRLMHQTMKQQNEMFARALQEREAIIIQQHRQLMEMQQRLVAMNGADQKTMEATTSGMASLPPFDPAAFISQNGMQQYPVPGSMPPTAWPQPYAYAGMYASAPSLSGDSQPVGYAPRDRSSRASSASISHSSRHSSPPSTGGSGDRSFTGNSSHLARSHARAGSHGSFAAEPPSSSSATSAFQPLSVEEPPSPPIPLLRRALSNPTKGSTNASSSRHGSISVDSSSSGSGSVRAAAFHPHHRGSINA